MKKTAFHFPGISIFVPEQRDSDAEIIALDQRALVPDDLPKKSKNFRLIRLIANIVLYHKRDDDRYDLSEPIQDFDPPIEIKVGYNIADIMENKGNFDSLKLAFWNGEKWVIISDPDHEYQILPPGTGQLAEAKIKKWAGDPPVGWGR